MPNFLLFVLRRYFALNALFFVVRVLRLFFPSHPATLKLRFAIQSKPVKALAERVAQSAETERRKRFNSLLDKEELFLVTRFPAATIVFVFGILFSRVDSYLVRMPEISV